MIFDLNAHGVVSAKDAKVYDKSGELIRFIKEIDSKTLIAKQYVVGENGIEKDKEGNLMTRDVEIDPYIRFNINKFMPIDVG